MLFALKYKYLFIVILLLAMIFLALGASVLGADEGDPEPETESDDAGILGGFFHFLGEVVAFPFRVIGNVFDAIF